MVCPNLKFLMKYLTWSIHIFALFTLFTLTLNSLVGQTLKKVWMSFLFHYEKFMLWYSLEAPWRGTSNK